MFKGAILKCQNRMCLLPNCSSTRSLYLLCTVARIPCTPRKIEYALYGKVSEGVDAWQGAEIPTGFRDEGLTHDAQR